MHSGKEKKFIFDINKLTKFKDKIIYIPIEEPPSNLIKIDQEDKIDTKQKKMIVNAKKREVYQINKTLEGISNANPDDIIIVSDIDEIPNLENINFEKINQKLIFFEQKMFYYKLNLFYKSMSWFGSKACKKKHLKTPEWLRSIKNKKYPFWRIDILFSKTKYKDIFYVNNGGWHFTNIREPEELEKKLMNFLHHVDFENSGIDLQQLKKLMNEKKIMYDHTADKKNDNKWGDGEKLKTVNISEMPKYIINNVDKYKKWLD
tara:strand:- start:203 stop:985 length:783 start_codon:yes stop_codon:yes gene_type:complete